MPLLYGYTGDLPEKLYYFVLVLVSSVLVLLHLLSHHTFPHLPDSHTYIRRPVYFEDVFATSIPCGGQFHSLGISKNQNQSKSFSPPFPTVAKGLLYVIKINCFTWRYEFRMPSPHHTIRCYAVCFFRISIKHIPIASTYPLVCSRKNTSHRTPLLSCLFFSHLSPLMLRRYILYVPCYCPSSYDIWYILI